MAKILIRAKIEAIFRSHDRLNSLRAGVPGEPFDDGVYETDSCALQDHMLRALQPDLNIAENTFSLKSDDSHIHRT